MNFLGIGTGELLLILLIVLLVMGPERLPQLIRQWAKVVKTLSQFTRTWQQFNAELNRQLSLEEMAASRPLPAKKPAAAPPVPEAETGDNAIAPPELAELDAASQSSRAVAAATAPPDFAVSRDPASPADAPQPAPDAPEKDKTGRPAGRQEDDGAPIAAEVARHEQ